MTTIGQLFISYSSKDADRVSATAEELTRRGVSIWLDTQQIRFSTEISEAINRGLTLSRFLVVFASQSYVTREWTKAEYTNFSYLVDDGGRRIAVVVLDDVALPAMLVNHLRIPWTDASLVADGLLNFVRSEDPSFPIVEQTRVS